MTPEERKRIMEKVESGLLSFIENSNGILGNKAGPSQIHFDERAVRIKIRQVGITNLVFRSRIIQFTLDKIHPCPQETIPGVGLSERNNYPYPEKFLSEYLASNVASADQETE